MKDAPSSTRWGSVFCVGALVALGTLLPASAADEPLVIFLGEGVEMEVLPVSGDYWVGKYEVTQEQFESVMGRNPSSFKEARKPVDSVTWDEALEFCAKVTAKLQVDKRLPAKLVCRLPTEKEWESFVGNARLEDSVVSEGGDRHTTEAVGSKAPNELGLYDVRGNVWEWCQDLTGPRGQFRVLRGASWSHADPNYLKVEYRNLHLPTVRHNYYGFRCVVARSTVP